MYTTMQLALMNYMTTFFQATLLGQISMHLIEQIWMNYYAQITDTVIYFLIAHISILHIWIYVQYILKLCWKPIINTLNITLQFKNNCSSANKDYTNGVNLHIQNHNISSIMYIITRIRKLLKMIEWISEWTNM